MAGPASRDEFGCWQSFATRWGDLDSVGHVNNARFFTFDEQARIDYVKARVYAAFNERRELNFILARAACDFLAQLHHPSTLEVGTRCTRLGGSSLSTRSGMFVGDQCVAVCEAVLVWFDYDAQTASRIPDAVRAEIRGFEALPPAAE